VTVLLDVAALLITAAGLLAGFGVLAVPRDLRQAVAVLLDFLTAAGLLRLAGTPSWPALVTAALVIALRHLVGAGLRAGWRGHARTGRRVQAARRIGS
jgi:hypothetical protein